MRRTSKAKPKRTSRLKPYQFAFARALVLLFMFHSGHRLPAAQINLIAGHLIRALPTKLARRLDHANDRTTIRIVTDVLRTLFPGRPAACR